MAESKIAHLRVGGIMLTSCVRIKAVKYGKKDSGAVSFLPFLFFLSDGSFAKNPEIPVVTSDFRHIATIGGFLKYIRCNWKKSL
jgi:hypothetical protein